MGARACQTLQNLPSTLQRVSGQAVVFEMRIAVMGLVVVVARVERMRGAMMRQEEEERQKLWMERSGNKSGGEQRNAEQRNVTHYLGT